MPRPKLYGKALFVRLPTEMQDAVEALAKRLTLAIPGVEFTTSDAARILITRGLESDKERPCESQIPK